MLSIGRRALFLIGILTTIGTVSLGGTLIAGHISAQSGFTKTIYACVRDRIGVVLIRSEFEACGTNWTPVEWNTRGPQGPTGDQGVRGAPGPAGAIGPAGAPGAQGAHGDKGETPARRATLGPRDPKAKEGVTDPPGPWAHRNDF